MRIRNLVKHADKNEVKKYFLKFINNYGECRKIFDFISYALTEYSDMGLDANLCIKLNNDSGDYIHVFTSELWIYTMYVGELEDYKKITFEVEIRSSDNNRRDEALACTRDLKSKLDSKFPNSQGCCTADVMAKAVAHLHIYIK